MKKAKAKTKAQRGSKAVRMRPKSPPAQISACVTDHGDLRDRMDGFARREAARSDELDALSARTKNLEAAEPYVKETVLASMSGSIQDRLDKLEADFAELKRRYEFVAYPWEDVRKGPTKVEAKEALRQARSAERAGPLDLDAPAGTCRRAGMPLFGPADRQHPHGENTSCAEVSDLAGKPCEHVAAVLRKYPDGIWHGRMQEERT